MQPFSRLPVFSEALNLCVNGLVTRPFLLHIRADTLRFIGKGEIKLIYVKTDLFRLAFHIPG